MRRSAARHSVRPGGALPCGMGCRFLFAPRSTELRRKTLPTLMVLPSLTPTTTPSPTLPPSLTPTFTADRNGRADPTRLCQPLCPRSMRACWRSRSSCPASRFHRHSPRFQQGRCCCPRRRSPVEPLPDATDTAPPFMGWYSFESDYPTVHYAPPGRRVSRRLPVAGSTTAPRAPTALPLLVRGEGLRVRYVAAPNMGMFEIVVDGVVLDTIDAYADTLTFPATGSTSSAAAPIGWTFARLGGRTTPAKALSLGWTRFRSIAAMPTR